VCQNNKAVCKIYTILNIGYTATVDVDFPQRFWKVERKPEKLDCRPGVMLAFSIALSLDT